MARALDAPRPAAFTRPCLASGGLALAVAHASRLVDERGIDGLIAALVRRHPLARRRARKLQSGLVHKELLLAVVGGALIFVLLMSVL